ncbi:MAG: metallophosphoesterase [Clostridia bacterium]|nr:metallophosphoesterase [Clostridia bacterium]
MIRLGIVSDSHGATSNMERVLLLLRDCDLIVHLGDHSWDARRMQEMSGRPFLFVRGNCDGRDDAPDEIITHCAGYRILLCHGHRLQVKFGLFRLSMRAQEAGAQIALFGHTHVPQVERDGGVLLVNPGALMSGCYATLEMRENGPVPLLRRLDSWK